MFLRGPTKCEKAMRANAYDAFAVSSSRAIASCPTRQRCLTCRPPTPHQRHDRSNGWKMEPRRPTQSKTAKRLASDLGMGIDLDDLLAVPMRERYVTCSCVVCDCYICHAKGRHCTRLAPAVPVPVLCACRRRCVDVSALREAGYGRCRKRLPRVVEVTLSFRPPGGPRVTYERRPS